MATLSRSKKGSHLRIQVPDIPPIAVPGPNAFAIAAKAEEEEAEVNATGGAMTPSSRDEPHLPHPEQHPRKEERGSAMTTFTQLMDAARSVSPRKSKHSSASTRHSSTRGSTTRSRHSERSAHSNQSNQPLEEALEFGAAPRHYEQTSRGEIESRTEKKFFKMMGQQPMSPTPGETSVVVASQIPKTVYTGAAEEPVKSPKKKLFGMSIPNFRTSGSSVEPPAQPAAKPAPDMPRKAAQLLVTGSAYKRREQARPQRSAPRSETSKSLPTKALDHHSRGSRRHKQTHTPSRSQQRSPRSKGSSPAKSVQWTSTVAGGESPGFGVPPTPPEKDTPPEYRGLQHSRSRGPGLALTEDTRIEQVEAVKKGSVVDRETPNFARPTSAIASEGGISPVKFVPHKAEEYAALIQGSPVLSSKGVVEADRGGLEEGVRSAPLEQDNRESVHVRLDRLSEQDHVHKRITRRMSGIALPPRFYTPSGFRVSMWESEGEGAGSRPSQNIDPLRYHLLSHSKQQDTRSIASNEPNCDNIDMMFRGTANEVDSDSGADRPINGAPQSTPPVPGPSENGLAGRFSQQLQVSERESREEGGRIRPTIRYPLPHNSSSRLTDMLGVVSPSKTGYNDFYPEYPSAMPAPLYGTHVPQLSHPNLSNMSPGILGAPLGDGTTIMNHFHMVNEHIDVLGRTTYDQVERHRIDQRATIEAQNRALVMQLEQKFEDVKATVKTSLEEHVEHISKHHHAIDGKMENLLDFIKTEVAGPLASQSQRTAEMEREVTQLQKTVQDLQKTIESKVTAPASVASNGASYGQYNGPPGLSAPPTGNLPHARSQPSLGFYDTVNEMARDGNQRLPPVQEARTESRYRYATPTHNGWQQHRSPHQAGKENMYAFSSPPNPYSSNTTAPYSGGYPGAGGYPGYFAGGQTDHGYSYSPGTNK